MTATFPPVPAGQRLRRLAALLLATLVLVTGVSVSMTRQSGARGIEVDELILPTLRLVHEMSVVVDEARGLSALHLLRADTAERQAVEDRLQAARQRIERRMAVSRQRLADDTERRHFQRVRTSLTAYWAAQDRLLAASRLAVEQPAAAAQARALLGGDSQAAFQQLRADLDAWWAYTDELAALAQAQGAAQARLQGGLLRVQALLLLGLLACAWAGWRTQRAAAPIPPPPPTPATPPAGAPTGLPVVSLDQLALQAHLLALNAAVVAARGGEAGRPTTATEHDLRQLAEQLDATAARLGALATGPHTGADRRDGRR